MESVINYLSTYLAEKNNDNILELLESSKEFADHNEWDLAFEDIIYICIDLQLDITKFPSEIKDFILNYAEKSKNSRTISDLGHESIQTFINKTL